MTTKRRTCRICTTRPIAPKHTDAGNVDLCNPCYDYAGWENTHSDQGHESFTFDLEEATDDDHAMIAEMSHCPICQEIIQNREARRGHTNTAPTSGIRIDHSVCAHPRTPKARAACRREMRAASREEGEMEWAASQGGAITDHGNGVFSIDTDKD